MKGGVAISNITIPKAICIIQDIKHVSQDEALTLFGNLVTLNNIENVLDDIVKMEKEYYLEQHPYKIYYSESDKRWRTYLPLTNGKRKPITSVTQKNLEKKIVDYYKQTKATVSDTLETLFPIFLNYKAKETSLANAHKLTWVWERFCQSDSLTKRKLSQIKVPELKEWYLDKIETFSLSNKQFKELKSLINMLYDYAIDMEITSYNVSRNVKGISYKKYAVPNKKDITEQVFIDNEEASLINLAIQQYHKTQNTAYLGVCLNFTLALRVGELVALEISDFADKTVHIQRQEIKKYITYPDGSIHRNGYEIVPYTKSLDSNRELILTQCARMIYVMILKANRERGFDSQYLMLNMNGQRMHNDAINKALRWLNQQINTPQKGNHSIRKTCLSNMSASNLLTDEEIRAFAGHKDISTTQKCYFFATESLESRLDAYESAINAKMPNVFKRVQV